MDVPCDVRIYKPKNPSMTAMTYRMVNFNFKNKELIITITIGVEAAIRLIFSIAAYLVEMAKLVL